jgi:hypothetical protein
MHKRNSIDNRERLRKRKTELNKQLINIFGFEKKFLIKECVDELFNQNDILKMFERKGAVMVLKRKIEQRIEKDRIKIGFGQIDLKKGKSNKNF